jgi:amino acid adenylation domain-containing protein
MTELPDDLKAKLARFSPEQRDRLKGLLKPSGRDQSSPGCIPRRSADQGIPLPSGQIGWPLSSAQERLWFVEQLQDLHGAYNISRAVQLHGPLDYALLRQSLQTIVDRHEPLHTTFHARDGVPLQVVEPHRVLELPVFDLRGVADSGEDLRQHLQTAAQAPFDLTRDLMLRARGFRLAAHTHVLLVVMHHIAGDGWSLGNLSRELSQLYRAYQRGKAAPLPPLTIQYIDFALWQRQQLQSPALTPPRQYWQRQLAAPRPVLTLPADRPRPSLPSYRGGKAMLTLAPALVATLKARSQDWGVTLFTTLLTAFKVLLYRYTDQTDLIVGTPIAGRTQVETEPLVGFLVNTLALRSDLSGNPLFSTLVQRVHQTAVTAYTHQAFPFDQVVASVDVDRDLSRSPLVQVTFGLQNTPQQDLQLPEIQLSSLSSIAAAPPQSALSLSSYGFAIDAGTARFDLSLLLKEEANQINGFVEYSLDLFEAATITRLIQHFQQLLTAIAADPDQPIATLPLLTAAERYQLLVTWNDTHRGNPTDPCIPQRFEAQVARHPDAIAVVCADQQMTYGELNARANQLAHHLQTLGVGPESRVAICVDPSLVMVIGVLGILKAGGAYVPLDPTYPPERLRGMLADAQCSVLLTQSQYRHLLPDPGMPVVDLERPDGAGAKDNPVNPPELHHLAYVIYTSGSTGQPKGVAVEHGQILNYCTSILERLPVVAGDSFAMVQPLTFDGCLTQLLCPLITGGSLHLFSRDMALNAPALADYFQHRGIDFLKITPSHLAALQGEVGLEPLMPRKLLMLGGEASPWDWFLSLQRAAPHCTVINHYGPTETTVGVLTYRLSSGDSPYPPATAPIGQPLANTQVYVLNAAQQPVPIGVAGELYIGGANVARGYLNRPQLTAERFIPNPFGPGRLYRTGDRVRRRPDGNLEFLGRIDQQVKIRGFRMEPGEIEAALGCCPGVQKAAVVARADALGSQQLVAYVVPQPGNSLSIRTLRSALAQTLPAPMVPSQFVEMAALPLLSNGKVDRKALPEPASSPSHREEPFVPPQTDTEQAIAAVWAEVLKCDRISRHDNFFELGGHSLIATQVVSRVGKTQPIMPTLRSLFEHPTLADWAQVIDLLGRAGRLSAPVVPSDDAEGWEHFEL